MEILFVIISILFTIIFVYLIGRTQYSHKGLIRAYKTSDFLVIIHTIFGLFMIYVIFVSLCACNNTFWHLPYL